MQYKYILFGSKLSATHILFAWKIFILRWRFAVAAAFQHRWPRSHHRVSSKTAAVWCTLPAMIHLRPDSRISDCLWTANLPTVSALANDWIHSILSPNYCSYIERVISSAHECPSAFRLNCSWAKVPPMFRRQLPMQTFPNDTRAIQIHNLFDTINQSLNVSMVWHWKQYEKKTIYQSRYLFDVIPAQR